MGLLISNADAAAQTSSLDGLVAEANELDSRSNQTGSAASRLLAYGIRVDGDKLFIAHQHPGLDRAFRDTLWADGAWKSALSRFGGAEKPRDPIRFGVGVKVRAVCLSISRILADPG